jgi:hypothetical protein
MSCKSLSDDNCNLNDNCQFYHFYKNKCLNISNDVYKFFYDLLENINMLNDVQSTENILDIFDLLIIKLKSLDNISIKKKGAMEKVKMLKSTFDLFKSFDIKDNFFSFNLDNVNKSIYMNHLSYEEIITFVNVINNKFIEFVNELNKFNTRNMKKTKIFEKFYDNAVNERKKTIEQYKIDKKKKSGRIKLERSEIGYNPIAALDLGETDMKDGVYIGRMYSERKNLSWFDKEDKINSDNDFVAQSEKINNMFNLINDKKTDVEDLLDKLKIFLENKKNIIKDINENRNIIQKNKDIFDILIRDKDLIINKSNQIKEILDEIEEDKITLEKKCLNIKLNIENIHNLKNLENLNNIIEDLSTIIRILTKYEDKTYLHDISNFEKLLSRNKKIFLEEQEAFFEEQNKLLSSLLGDDLKDKIFSIFKSFSSNLFNTAAPTASHVVGGGASGFDASSLDKNKTKRVKKSKYKNKTKRVKKSKYKNKTKRVKKNETKGKNKYKTKRVKNKRESKDKNKYKTKRVKKKKYSKDKKISKIMTVELEGGGKLKKMALGFITTILVLILFTFMFSLMILIFSILFIIYSMYSFIEGVNNLLKSKKNEETIETIKTDDTLDNIELYFNYKTKRGNLDKVINSKKIEYEKKLNIERKRISDEINKIEYSNNWKDNYDDIQKSPALNKDLKIIISKMKKRMKIRLPDKRLVNMLRREDFDEYFKQKTQYQDKIKELIFDLFKNKYEIMSDSDKDKINICLETDSEQQGSAVAQLPPRRRAAKPVPTTPPALAIHQLDKCKNPESIIEIKNILIKYL